MIVFKLIDKKGIHVNIVNAVSKKFKRVNTNCSYTLNVTVIPQSIFLASYPASVDEYYHERDGFSSFTSDIVCMYHVFYFAYFRFLKIRKWIL